jgi:hypothetical protein
MEGAAKEAVNRLADSLVAYEAKTLIGEKM